MNRSYQHYKLLAGGAILLFLALVLLQVNWLRKAVFFQKEKIQYQLQQLVPDMALAIDGIDRDAFHADFGRMVDIPIDSFEVQIKKVLNKEGLSLDLSFAVYQDTSNGILITNQKKDSTALRDSEIRSCLSCIVSFSVAREGTRKLGESDEDYRARLVKNAEFQYFSPVPNFNIGDKPVLWLSVYLPDPLLHSLKALIYLFTFNVLLLILLLALFYYLLRALARHKQLSQIKDDFFNNMTHEFKTPLSSIRLASRVLKESQDHDKRLVYFGLIEKESKRMEQQIDQLLQLSLLDQKELAFAAKDINLKAVIEEIPDRLRLLLQEKHAELILNLNLEE